MKNRIDHIIRSVTITCLMAGLLAHLVVPFSSQAQKTAFTRWLNYNVVASGNESEIKLRNTISELPEQSGDFLGLVREASELVANHKDHFKIFDFDKDTGESDNPPESNWLIDQWNNFQNQKSGFNSVLIESVKILSKWIPNSPGFSSFKGHFDKYQTKIPPKLFFYSFRASTDLIQPLSSGISINAP
ncbi:MAG: hypothetical protein GVY07_09490 [Bacteroidetes bacterium]|nr:hypothetical protein [Bacteroidota bacterium]